MIYIVSFHIRATASIEVEDECCECGSTIYKEKELSWDDDLSYTVAARDPDHAWEAACIRFQADHRIAERFDLQALVDGSQFYPEAAVSKLRIEPLAMDVEAAAWGHPQLFPLADYGPAMSQAAAAVRGIAT